MALASSPTPPAPPDGDEPPPPRIELPTPDPVNQPPEPHLLASDPLPGGQSQAPSPPSEAPKLPNQNATNPDPHCCQSIHLSDSAADGEIDYSLKQDSLPRTRILTDLAQDIQRLLQTNREDLKTKEGEQKSPRHKEPHRKGTESELSSGSCNGDAEIHATHCEAQCQTSPGHQEHSVKSILKATRPAAAPQASKPRTVQAWQNQKRQTSYSEQEKAKGVLEALDSSPQASPVPSSFRQPSMHHIRDPSGEIGETSKQAQNFSGMGRWAEVKPPYWWRKEQQQSRTLIEPSRRTDPGRGKELFRRHAADKCFNCLATGHQVRECRNPTHCWRCERSGHHAFKCLRLSADPTDLKPPLRAQQSAQLPHPVGRTPPLREEDRRSYLEVLRGPSPMAYPGDPRARPAGERICISATGAIKRRHDKLVGKAAVCWLEENSHDTEVHHVVDAIRTQLGIMDLQVVKHYPEQYLVIFSDPRNMQRAVRQRYIVSSGRTYNFAPWDENREAVDAHMEFRAYVRIEGIPLHAWGLEVAEKVLGKECAIHYVEEHTRRKERTRTFDLWAWCSDPCKIPNEVWLTITDPDAEQPPVDIPQAPVHRDPPTDIKHGLTYHILPHVATVEDLSFIRGNGGLGGLPNRKRCRNFDWRYGIPDILGEARGCQHEGHGRDGHGHHRRDDDDEDRRGHHRRHRSASAWGRITRCRIGAADCYSSNFRGAGGSFLAGRSHRSRAWMCEPKKLVYKVKVAPTPLSNRGNKEGAETRAVKKAPSHADPTGQKEKNKENGLNLMLVKVHNSATSNTNHFVKPINMVEMEALQDLVEHGTKMEKAGKNKGAARQREVA